MIIEVHPFPLGPLHLMLPFLQKLFPQIILWIAIIFPLGLFLNENSLEGDLSWQACQRIHFILKFILYPLTLVYFLSLYSSFLDIYTLYLSISPLEHILHKKRDFLFLLPLFTAHKTWRVGARLIVYIVYIVTILKGILELGCPSRIIKEREKFIHDHTVTELTHSLLKFLVRTRENSNIPP